MIKRLRIISGLILFVFVALHLANIGLGLWSVELMEEMRPVFMGVWSNQIGGTVLAVTLLVHLTLGLHAIYRRNTFNVSAGDIVQIISSLILVPLLIPHLVGTGIAKGFFELPQNYPGLLLYFWETYPAEGLRQVLLLVIVWIHGCIGLFTWLKLQGWFRRIAPYIYPMAVALPVLAMLSYVQGGRAVMSGEVAVVYARPPENGPSFDEILASLSAINRTLIALFLIAVVIMLFARAWRLRVHKGVTRVAYSGESTFAADNGLTLLESARVHGIPHASICGGRGRCGTCRVQILDSTEPLPPKSDEEQMTLERIGAGPDVRLACQLKVHGGRLAVQRLLSPDFSPIDPHAFENMPEHDPHGAEIVSGAT